MTALTLTLPRLGETMDEATVVGWLVEPGAAFRRGQPIVELETDKTVVEYPALGDGVLDEILASSGDRIPVGAPLARATVADAGDWADDIATPGAAPEPAPAVGGAAGVATLLMPRLGETMEEATVVGWLVEPGAAFRRGQPIVELETDKTVVEYPALGDGILEEVLAGAGARIAVGAPIARARVEDALDWASEAAPEPSTDPAPALGGAAGVATLLMPRLGETMDEGTVIRWLVAPGAAYVRGDALLEIETDKTVAEVPALSDGRMIEHLVPEGARAAVGAPLATLEGEVEDAADPLPASLEPEAASAPVVAAPRDPLGPGSRRRATPVARRLARQAGVAIDTISGSGRRGRVEARDVRAVGSGHLARSGASGVAFDTFGPEQTECVLLLHGFAGDRRAWAAVAAILARAGRRVVVPDLPAHGETAIDADDLDTMTAAMADFAATIPGRLHLVGHSLGAVVATALAVRLGDRVPRLTLVTPAGCGREISEAFITGMAAARTPGEVAHLLRLLGPKGGALSDAALAAIAAETARGRLAGLAADFTGALGQRTDILRPLAALARRLPVSALFGTEDRVIPALHALALPPQVAVHFFPTGHMPQWDAPAEVAEVILGGPAHA
jgi:pyruvate dehydrogenase E2 component (dihydrolipoamide acetyltransferase)